MNARSVFGANVRRLRTVRQLSQERLGELAGLDRTYIGSVERGERNLSLDNIVAIAGALGVPIADLFKGIEQRSSSIGLTDEKDG